MLPMSTQHDNAILLRIVRIYDSQERVAFEMLHKQPLLLWHLGCLLVAICMVRVSMHMSQQSHW